VELEYRLVTLNRSPRKRTLAARREPIVLASSEKSVGSALGEGGGGPIDPETNPLRLDRRERAWDDVSELMDAKSERVFPNQSPR